MHYWQAIMLVVLSGLAGGFVSAVASLLDPGKTDKGYEATKGVPMRTERERMGTRFQIKGS